MRSVTRQPPLSSPPARRVTASVEAGPRQEYNDRIVALVVAKLPDLTAEEAVKYIKILGEKNPGKLTINDILNGVEELWKNSLGAVGGDVGPVGPVSFAHGRQAGGQLRRRPKEAEPAAVEEEEDECSICLEPLMPGDPDHKELKPCQHKFHLHCIQVNFGPLSLQ